MVLVLPPLWNSNLLNLTLIVASIRGQEVNRTRNRSRCRDHPQKKKTAANLSVSGNSLQIWNVENMYTGISCLEEEILMGFTHHSSLHPLYFI